MTKRRKPNGSPAAATFRFGVLTFAGIADVTRRELQPFRPAGLAVFRLRDHDLIVAEMERADAARLADLKTAEDIFYMMGEPLPLAGRRDLATIGRLLSRAQVLAGLRLKSAVSGPPRRTSRTFACFVKHDRDREVRRKDIAERVAALVASRFPRWRNADPAGIELWGFYIDRVLHLGLRLSDERMRYRGRKPQRRAGALRPTIAAALALLADPRPGELIVDPMCGTGTILEEALLREKAARYAGGDSAQEAVDLAEQRLAPYGIPVRQWDARKLPLDDRSADCIICNLPFGKRYSTAKRNPSLYRALLSNWRRKLKPAGRMILLTSDSQALERCLRSLGLPWRRECRAKVLGRWAAIYAVENTAQR